MSNIFEKIASTQTMDFSDNYETQFNFFEKFFPEQRTSAEFIKVTDYDVDYNPTALAVPDNTISPLAEFPDVDHSIMDMVEFKLEYQLTDGQIRKLLTASTDAEIQEGIKEIFKMEERLINSHYIARERVRAMAFTGKVDINENNFHPTPWDYKIPEEQCEDIDLTKDDLILKGRYYNRLISKTYGKRLARILLTDEQIAKISLNEKFRATVLGVEQAKARSELTEEEVISGFAKYLKWEVIKIQDNQGNDYFWTDINKVQHPFLPTDKIIVLPNIKIGATPVGYTAEELTLAQQDGIVLKNEGGIAVLANYEPRPVKFILTAVSRFAVVYPKAPCSMVLTDTSQSIEDLYKAAKG